ncbi:MAG TPA: TonB-dependent receptor [Lysobacter sp.]|nr:TonB-dependent receptor [Lysobacter sp.]
MSRTQPQFARSPLACALVVAILSPAAFAQDPAPAPTNESNTQSQLDRVVVTGSLIPQTAKETFTPVTVISAEDIAARGFTSVSDVLQQSSFSTGGVQGGQTSAGFTQGAETMSLFGLSVGYTKYLIDGRPMADYPALYNGSDTFNNISGIPIDLVERIEILPGGQSSLYGSDAIAGVVNVILKKRLDAPVISLRAGTYTDGGGDSGRISAATTTSALDDRFNLLVGAQYENREPIWGYERELTKQYNRNGRSPALASRDFMEYGYRNFGTAGFDDYGYFFNDPNNCANTASLFSGTVGLQDRPGYGQYCGSLFSPGYRTIQNGKEAFQAYTHATYELNTDHQLYADVLYSHENVDYNTGSGYTWWGTGVGWGYFYDPNIDGLMNLQRGFAPEEFGPGGYENSMNRDTSASVLATVGARGTLGASGWDYDAFVSGTRYTLKEHGFARLAGPIDAWFQENVLGPDLGPDPYYGAYPTFSPNYARFYSPLTAADIASFTAYTDSRSRTSDLMARAQVTNSALFSLPGGDAGIALALEGGHQKWNYTPDARLLNGDIWGTTAVSGGGDRDRYAAIGELRLPVFEPLTVSLSSRYDKFDPTGAQPVSKTTYSLGLEYRPVQSLLLRGKYGTAFKAPTLADQFQGQSGYYSSVVDYFQCQLQGYGPGEVDDCPARYTAVQYFGTTSGGLDLRPMNADVWSAGIVWAPTAKFSIGADLHHWEIEDEVGQQNAGGLALREMYCRTGAEGYDINSPVCQDALSKITRNSAGTITEIYTPKVNEALEVLSALTLNASYQVGIGRYGDLLFRGSYTNNLKHEYTAFAGDEVIDLLRRPDWSSDPKTKANASVTWSRDNWGATLYANRIGHVPNYLAQVSEDGYADESGLAGKLKPLTLYNLSVDYQPLPQLSLSMMVNNIFNSMPPEDPTYPGSSGEPYNAAQYSPYGRAVYVEARWKFGAK